jgi:hypothetical protein
MIRKNDSLIEDVLHFEIYDFLEVFGAWLCKTSCGNQLIKLFFRLS